MSLRMLESLQLSKFSFLHPLREGCCLSLLELCAWCCAVGQCCMPSHAPMCLFIELYLEDEPDAQVRSYMELGNALLWSSLEDSLRDSFFFLKRFLLVRKIHVVRQFKYEMPEKEKGENNRNGLLPDSLCSWYCLLQLFYPESSRPGLLGACIIVWV